MNIKHKVPWLVPKGIKRMNLIYFNLMIIKLKIPLQLAYFTVTTAENLYYFKKSFLQRNLE